MSQIRQHLLRDALEYRPADFAAVMRPFGESSTTSIVIAGSFTGAKPTNEELYCIRRVTSCGRIDLLRRSRIFLQRCNH